MEPLQVMPLDESFNLVSGPLDYESLQWNRRYYEAGDFSMSVLSSDYDPSWAYIYTPFRPEMGIIQKVECADTSHTPDGKDTVTVSGFFLDFILDKLVFLVEETEQQKVMAPKPSRPSNSAPKPNLKQDADGNLYFEYGASTNSHHYNNVETGECIWPDQIEGEETWTDVPLSAGDGMSEQQYPVRDAEGNVTGYFGSGWYNTKYNYYSSDDGKLHVVGNSGEKAAYDLVGNGTNAVIYKDDDGSYKWVWGVVEEGEESAKDKYRREVEQWEQNTKSLQVDDDGNYFYYRTVKGPWQLRTDIDDVTTPQDNVQWIIKMAQKVFGNNFFYDEPDFTGETKVLSPSLTRIGDFFRQELKTIQAGLRIFYSFKANQMIFQIWRGLDRTQDENAPGADDDVQPVAIAAFATPASAAGSLPGGYTKLMYIEGTGTQYIDTGITLDQDSGIVLDMEIDSSANLNIFGARNIPQTGDTCNVHIYNGSLSTWYGSSSHSFGSPPVGRFTITTDKGSFQTSTGLSYTHSAQSFTCPATMLLFGFHENGKPITLGSMRAYSCKIFDDGNLICDLVPVRREGDSAVGMYDLVGGQFYGNLGSGSFSAGPVVVDPIEDQLTYYPNSLTATGSTLPTSGYQGQPVVVAQCGFIDSQRTFTGWNTMEDGTGTTYQPGSEYVLTEGSDVLYAQWTGGPGPDPGPDVPDGNAWAVFSDRWGSLYDYSASVDDSNYRNLCYVLYEYDEPEWDDDGHPVVKTVTGEYLTQVLGYQVAYSSQRGHAVVRLEDGYEDRETWLDKRNEKPEQDGDWPRDMQEEMPDVSGVTKESYDRFRQALRNEGLAYLEESYPIVKNLDTGTLDMSDYLTGFDLGDKVDMEVSTLGLKETARIIEVEEVYESGRSEIHLTMGDELVTDTKKARLN